MTAVVDSPKFMKPDYYIYSVLMGILVMSCGAPERVSVYHPSALTAAEREWNKVHALEDTGDYRGAAAQYAALCNGKEQYPRACYSECRALLEIPDIPTALTCARDFLIKHPNYALAPSLVRKVANSFGSNSQYLEGADWLAGLLEAVRQTDVWDSIQFERARLFREAGMTPLEEDALNHVVELGRWGSQLWDNALWRLIEIQHAYGNDQKEETLLLQMLSRKVESRLIASYNSPYYDDALFRLGALYRRRNELNKAYSAFWRLSTWDTSRLRDDALLQCAEIKRDTDEPQKACSLLKRLITEFAESSSVRKAKKLSDTWGCGQVADEENQ